MSKLSLTVIQELEKQIASFGSERDKHVKAAQAKLKAARAAFEQAKAKLKVRQNVLQRICSSHAACWREASAPCEIAVCKVAWQFARRPSQMPLLRTDVRLRLQTMQQRWQGRRQMPEALIL